MKEKSWPETGNELDLDIRLDCYVDPQLAWVKHVFNDGRGSFRENIEDLTDLREDQPWAAFQKIRNAKRNLVFSDGAGAGKTILTRRLAYLISKAAIGSHEPLMVFRFVKPLPVKPAEIDSLRQLLLAEPILNDLKISDKKITDEEKSGLIQYALDRRRVVVIFDGLDEFSNAEKNSFLQLLTCINGQFTKDPVGGDPSKVTTIIAGRQHAIDEHLQHYFHQSRFERLKIQPFSEELQDEYFHGKNKSEINNPDRNPIAKSAKFHPAHTWRDCLPEDKDSL
ncbi:MAG: NACHT domain-containing protein, partial [Isosphaeraceae bacterium]